MVGQPGAARAAGSTQEAASCGSDSPKLGAAPAVAPTAAAAAAEPATCFSRSSGATPPVIQDAGRLLLAGLEWLILFWRQRGEMSAVERPFCLGGALLAALGLLCAVAAPALYRRLRTPIIVALQAHMVAAPLVVDGGKHVGGLAAGSLSRGGLVPVQAFLLFVLGDCGVNVTMLQGPLSFQLPFVLGAAIQLASSLTFGLSNIRLCRAEYLQHPTARSYMSTAYRWLEPAVAPLEPLLLAVGPRRSNPCRHCFCVMAALQFWLVQCLPIYLLARGHCLRYHAWRATQRAHERERRSLQTKEWGFPFDEPSSSSGEPSSGEEGDNPAGQPRAARRGGAAAAAGGAGLTRSLLAALPGALQRRRASARRVRRWRSQGSLHGSYPHHPEDWQYVWACRFLRATRVSISLAEGAMLAAAWAGAYVLHRHAFA